MSGVCWYGEQRGQVTVFSTVNRAITVRVAIPTTYEGQLIAGFSAPVSSNIPTSANVPPACR
jgi:hypothetical protein